MSTYEGEHTIFGLLPALSFKMGIAIPLEALVRF
jgi:hypothetical protein